MGYLHVQKYILFD